MYVPIYLVYISISLYLSVYVCVCVVEFISNKSCCLMIPYVTQVESIVLSIISMLSSPNDESPANVEAAVSSSFISFSFCCRSLILAMSLCCNSCLLIDFCPHPPPGKKNTKWSRICACRWKQLSNCRRWWHTFVIVILQKQWREDRDGFRKKVSRCVRKSQEMLWPAQCTSQVPILPPLS